MCVEDMSPGDLPFEGMTIDRIVLTKKEDGDVVTIAFTSGSSLVIYSTDHYQDGGGSLTIDGCF